MVNFSNYYYYSFDNFGTFDLSDGTLTINAGTFTNDTSGQINVGAGETLEIDTGFINAGTISVAAGGRLDVNGATDFSNTGAIRIAAGGVVDIDNQTVSLDELGQISGAGLLSINTGATLDLGGGTLTLGAADLNVSLAAVIAKGTVVEAGGTLLAPGQDYSRQHRI